MEDNESGPQGAMTSGRHFNGDHSKCNAVYCAVARLSSARIETAVDGEGSVPGSNATRRRGPFSPPNSLGGVQTREGRTGKQRGRPLGVGGPFRRRRLFVLGVKVFRSMRSIMAREQSRYSGRDS